MPNMQQGASLHAIEALKTVSQRKGGPPDSGKEDDAGVWGSLFQASTLPNMGVSHSISSFTQPLFLHQSRH